MSDVFVRVMDEASKGYSLKHLESHLTNGILTFNERRKLGIEDHLTTEGAYKMYTNSDEISVFTCEQFKFFNNVCGNYVAGILINSSVIKASCGNHLVISQSTPISERKIIAIYADIKQVDLQEINNIMQKTGKKLPIYDKNFNLIKS